MLYEEHEDPEVAEGDRNKYTFGSIGGHNIVMACLPSGTMGITPAAKGRGRHAPKLSENPLRPWLALAEAHLSRTPGRTKTFGWVT
jgi:hypothetical protein